MIISFPDIYDMLPYVPAPPDEVPGFPACSVPNCMIQSEDQLIALCAAGREKTSPRIVEIYDEYGRGEQAADYRVMRYRELRDDNGDSAGVVVSSSGYEQEGWNVLENDQMIIASNRNGTYRLRSI